MALEMVGVGSQYAVSERDADGAYLEGGGSYRLRLPADVPAKEFRSVVAYDPQTRSELQTGQPFPSRNSERNADELTYNEDGSIDILFGPESPTENSGNWIETIAGKSWYTILRLYGPLSRGSNGPGCRARSSESTEPRQPAGRRLAGPQRRRVDPPADSVQAWRFTGPQRGSGPA